MSSLRIPSLATSRQTRRSRRLTGLAAAIACGLGANLALPVAHPAFTATAIAAEPGTTATDEQMAAFRATLEKFGSFEAHDRYGEIWVPSETTVPVGWHPYEPCNWVYAKDLGWYYDDRTDWGRIVHHYGRWTHEAGRGWVWVAGSEFSPGWVVWRTSDRHVGWAPLLPDQDVKTVSAESFNTDKHWIFMDAKKFGVRCASPQIVSATPAIFETTKLVTEIRMVNGIAIFVLPSWLVINIVDIDIGIFHPWTPCFFGAWFWNWNWIQNNIIINVNFPQGPQQCQPQPEPLKEPLQKIKSDPPPPPGKPLSTPPRTPKPEQRADDDTPVKPPHRVGQGPFIPPVIVPKFPRPHFELPKPRLPKRPGIIVDPRPDKPHGRNPQSGSEIGQNSGHNGNGPSTGPSRPGQKRPSLTIKQPKFDLKKLVRPKFDPPRRVQPATTTPPTLKRFNGASAATASKMKLR